MSEFSLMALNLLMTLILFSMAFLTLFCRSADSRHISICGAYFNSLLPRPIDPPIVGPVLPLLALAVCAWLDCPFMAF